MNRKALTESDICDQFITPSLVKAGWDPATQIRREVIAGIPEGFSWEEIGDREEAIRSAIRLHVPVRVKKITVLIFNLIPPKFSPNSGNR